MLKFVLKPTKSYFRQDLNYFITPVMLKFEKFYYKMEFEILHLIFNINIRNSVLVE